MANEMAPSSWGMTVNDLISGGNYNRMYLAIPHTEQCFKWSDSDEAMYHRIRFRWHGDVSDAANEIRVRARVGIGETIKYRDHTGGADAWDATWANANETNEHPEGHAVPILSDETKAPRYYSPLLKWDKESNDGTVNGIEIGIVNDVAHASPDLDCELADRAGAERMYTAKRAACSWLMADSLAHTYNMITEMARWRIACPMAGYR